MSKTYDVDPMPERMKEFVEMIARLTKDGECSACLKSGSQANPECEDHEAFDMPSDDAVETLHQLIEWARDLVTREVEV